MDWVKYSNFTEDEFRCRCCGKAEMEPAFMAALQYLRDTLGFPLHISSGYRCPEYNAKVSSTGKTGPHTTGKAADVLVAGADAYEVVKDALRLGFNGIGINQKGPWGGRFIHLDTLSNGEGPRPRIWSY